ncbi:11367_t:CDS:1 [Diversispora eburnea]|uniref:11367_t:CDS:1 n=1 Tax=Diversispora eburnea TaxID=1213867 RepID=A0A9N8YMI7_9GLOM|nr:11367_t:CDS:1 [Diversispora eburnea]
MKNKYDTNGTRTRSTKRRANSDDVKMTKKVATFKRSQTRKDKKNDKKEANDVRISQQDTIYIVSNTVMQAKIPLKILAQREFSLPQSIFGEMMRNRVTTFIVPDTAMPTGPRKSKRSALAFGSRIPSKILIKREFFLPKSIFEKMMKEREAVR